MPSPRFIPRHAVGLPRLSWCARLCRDNHEVELIHGSRVEVHGDAFVAGVWNGPFGELGFGEAHTVAGSAGRVAASTLQFSNSSHLFDHLYSLRSGNQLFVGNSLPLVLASAGDDLELRHRRYRAALYDLLRDGLAGSPVRLPSAAGGELLAHAATDIAVGTDLEVVRVERPQPPDPGDYDGYHRLLADTVAALVANATDAQRHHPLATVTTLSSGYDSAVSALLGSAAGVRDAVTSERGLSDDGADVARALGLRLTSIDGQAWKHMVPCPDVEFSASIGRGRRLGLAALEGQWSDSIVLTGTLGDKLWERERSLMGPDLREANPRFIGCMSVQEFALRAGLVFVHVPAIGATHPETIRRITVSDALAPWSIGGSYDRPIARRMLEEAGVPRSEFGWVKRAGITIAPEDGLSDESREDFEHFWVETQRSLGRATRARFWVETHLWQPFVVKRARRLARRLRWRRVARALTARSRHPDPRASYEYHWAVNRLTNRAAAALRVGGESVRSREPRQPVDATDAPQPPRQQSPPQPRLHR